MKSTSKSSEKFTLRAEDIKKAMDYALFYSRELGLDALPPTKSNGWLRDNVHCPFHPDENPSFGANLLTGHFKCLACGAAGDAFEFYRKRHACDFREALKALAAFAGIDGRTAPPAPPAPAKKKSNEPPKIKIAEFFYKDADGKIIMRVEKLINPHKPSKKDFPVSRPDGRGGWKYGKAGIEIIPYNLPELIGADLIFIPEGEKDCDTLAALNLTATTNPFGAEKWPTSFREYFNGKHVVILPDCDMSGRNHALMIAKNLHGAAASIKIIELPGLGPKGEVTDWLALGHTKDELLSLADACPCWEPPTESDDDDSTGTDDADDADAGGPGRKRKPSMADMLMTLIPIESLFHDAEGTGFADIDRDGHRETWPLRSKAFRDYLAFLAFKIFGKIPTASTTADALNGLSGIARFEGPERQVHVRLGGIDEKIFLDLGGADWSLIEINADGWQKITASPEHIRFWRPRAMLPMPEPVHGGSIELLNQIIRLESYANLMRVTAWLLSALNPKGPYPILVIAGGQGAGKTWAAKCLRRLVDDNIAPLRSMGKNEHDLWLSAKNSRVFAPDNLSSIRAEEADLLCRLASGGGFATRTLFSDDEECIFNFSRPVILNGIPDLLTRADLSDRAICIDLPARQEEPGEDAEGGTIDEEALIRTFEETRPLILGGLLDAVSSGIRHRPQVKLKNPPRLADAALWWVACEMGGALPWAPGGCLDAFRASRENIVGSFIESDMIASAVVKLTDAMGRFSGTAAELLAAMNQQRGDARPPRGWPDNARALSNKIKRASSFLREHGIGIDFERKSSGRYIHISFLYNKKASSFASLSSFSNENEILFNDETKPLASLSSLDASHTAEPEVF